ncbi:transcription factor-like 5 protein [Gasterosteus aculeatus]
MSSDPSVCATLHVPPSPVTIDRGQVLAIHHAQVPGPEAALIEMSEVEYTHLQHLIHVHMEPHVAAAGWHLAAAASGGAAAEDDALTSPIVTTQAIDLSTSTDEHYQAMPAEKTPGSRGEVPGFVLARVRVEDTPTEIRSSSNTSSQARSRSAARVCLEKRFNALSADAPRPQEVQSAVFSNFLTVLQQSAEAQEAVIHMTNPFEDCSPYGGSVFNQVTNICEQVIGSNSYMVEPDKHQGLIIPKGFSFNFHPERVVTKAHYTISGSNSTAEQQLVTTGNDVGTPAVFRKHGGPRPGRAASAAPDSAGESGSSASKRARSHISLIQRRERHNSKERERRKRIRLYCDELNTLVPFCKSYTDKVTTLQWTTAFLSYIQQTYGDAFKEEFQNAFADGKGPFLKSSLSSGPDATHRGTDEALSISHVVEQ